MKVFLRDIPYEGLFVTRTVSAPELGLVDENFVCKSPLDIDVNFEKVDEALVAQVAVRGSYELACASCLEPIPQDREDEFEVVFDITPETEFVEYGDDIRQELLLALSEIVRCKEDCKGLCRKCGENLNKTTCNCHKVTKSEGHNWI